MDDISSNTIRYVQSESEIELLVSPVRQEIVDNLAAMGPSSVGELARVAGVQADTLYYHVKKLVRSGLVVERGTRQTSRREETLYGLPAAVLQLRYDVPPEARALIRRLIAATLRTAARDFGAGLESEEAVAHGPSRNLWAARAKGWLDAKDLAQLNDLLDRIQGLFESSRPGPGRQLCSLSWALAPVRAMPPRRESR